MALVDHEQFSSMESKAGNMMTAEEERDHNKQRLQSMKLVLKELQQQLSVYKTRCSGVNTIALMLQESKQEVVKLTKQRKALETAITNLQNRLSTNGLSSSVTIEETDMFVPGASKQTLDNLAKENARLRTLLKSHEGQVEKKSSEDMQKMAELIKKLEAENNHLRAQILQIDHWKVGLTNQFEDEMKQIKAEKLQLELDLNQQQETRVEVSNENKYNNNETNLYKIVHSKSNQTFEIEPSKIDEVRRTLKILTDHCVVLDQSLETLQIPVKTEVNVETSATDKDNVVSTEAYLILKQKFKEVVQMNQHWQIYNENKDQQIHGLLAKITELEELSKKADEFRSALEVKEIENQNLRRDIASLTKEITKFKSQPQFDISLVEILKQQIQVCTEDFNTERKDREHAVNKAKQLQEEVNRLSLEVARLKRENDDFQKMKLQYSPEAINQRCYVPTQMLPQYFPRGAPSPPPRLPFSSGYSGSSGSSQPSGHSLSPIPSPIPMSLSSTSSVSDRSSYYPPSHHDNVSGFQTPTRGSLKHQVGQIGNQSSFPRARGPRENLADTIDRPADMSVSMPALSVKTEDLSNNKQPDLTCPKCSKEFSDNQQSKLINHINNCHE